MDKSNECKGCSANVRQSFAEVAAKMDEFIRTVEPQYRVSEDVYRARLAVCGQCSGLYYETTCRHCGCFVQMRALRSNRDCPDPSGSRWEKITPLHI